MVRKSLCFMYTPVCILIFKFFFPLILQQVEAFMLYYEENGGILHLLQQFMLVLLKRYEHKWPAAAAKMYTEIYPRVRLVDQRQLFVMKLGNLVEHLNLLLFL